MSGHGHVTPLCIIKMWSAIRAMQTSLQQGEGILVEQTALLSPSRALCNRELLENVAGLYRGAVCSA